MKKYIIFLIYLTYHLTLQKFTQTISYKYNLTPENQEAKMKYTVQGYPTINLRNISQILEFGQAGNMVIQGSNDLKTYNLYMITQTFGSQYNISVQQLKGVTNFEGISKVIFLKSSQTFLIITPELVYYYSYNSEKSTCSLIKIKGFDFGSIITSAKAFSETQIYISSNTGLYLITLGEQDQSIDIRKTHISDVAVFDVAINNILGIIAVGTKEKLWFYYTKVDDWRFEYTESVVDDAFSLVWRLSTNELWVSSQWASNIVFFDTLRSEIKPPYSVYRAGFVEGFPNTNITCSYWNYKTDTLYFGGLNGLSSYSSRTSDIIQFPSFSNYKEWQGIGQIGSLYSPWSYYNDQRFMTNGEILSISSSTTDLNPGIYIVTTYGLTFLTEEKGLELNDKEEFNQKRIETHNRYGLFADAKLKIQGSTEELELYPQDDDSILTNQYLVSQSYKYKITKDSKAKQQAKTAFQGLKRLFDVTGIKGLMAKTIANSNDGVPTGDNWHQSTVQGLEEWYWRGNTSNNDAISFYFGFISYIENVCESDEEKQETIDLLLDNINYIIKNNYQLFDITGKPTEYGYWNPEYLNGNSDNYVFRGINSLQIVTMLSVAYHYSQNQEYLDRINQLGQENLYFQNILNWRVQKINDQNYILDQSGYMTYFAFFSVQNSIPTNIQKIMTMSLQRTYSIVQAYQPSLWTIITALSLKDNYSQVVSEKKIADVITELEQWPIDWIQWNIDNKNRQDIALSKNYESSEETAFSMGILKRSERAGNMKWDDNPYLLNCSESNGNYESTSVSWLLPYWLYQSFKAQNINYDLIIKQQELQE